MNDVLKVRNWLLFLAAISFATTGAGFAQFLQADGPVVYAVAFLVSGIVQGLIVVTARNITRPMQSGLLSWFLSVGGYFLCAFFSVGFSVSFYFGLIASDSFADEQFAAQHREITLSVRTLLGRYEALDQKLAALATYSKRKAELETRSREEGWQRTCANSRGPGEGPAMRKRLYQSATFASIAADFGKKRDNLSKIAEELEALDESTESMQARTAALADGLLDLQAMYERPDFELLHAFVGYEMAGFPEGRPEYAAFAGAHNACRDTELVGALQSVFEATLPAPPDLRVRTLRADDPSAVITLVFESFFDALGGEVQQGTSIFDRQFRFPLLLGFLVDLLILFFSFWVAARVKRHDDSGPAKLVELTSDVIDAWAPLRAHLQQPGEITPDMSGAIAAFNEIVAVGLIRHRDERYLFVPKAGQGHLLFDATIAATNTAGDFLERLREALDGEGMLRPCEDEPMPGLPHARITALLQARLRIQAGPGTPLDRPYDVFAVYPEIGAWAAECTPSMTLAVAEPIDDPDTLPLYGERGWSVFCHALYVAYPKLTARYVSANAKRVGGRWAFRVPRRGPIPGDAFVGWLTRYAVDVRPLSILRPRDWLHLPRSATEVTYDSAVDAQVQLVALGMAPSAGRVAGLSQAEQERRLAELVQNVVTQDLSEHHGHPTRHPWAWLADEMTVLIDALEAADISAPALAPGRACAALAYTHAGEDANAQKVLGELRDDASLSPAVRMFVDIVRLARAIGVEVRWAECEPIIARLVETLDELDAEDTRFLRGRALGSIGRAYLHHGDVDEALEWLGQAVEAHESDEPKELARSRTYLAMARRERYRQTGDDEDAAAAAAELERARTDLESHARPEHVLYATECEMYLRYEEARLALATGRDREALDIAGDALHLSRGRPWPTLGLLRTRAIAAARAGDRQQAAADRRGIEEIARAGDRLGELAVKLIADVTSGAESTVY